MRNTSSTAYWLSGAYVVLKKLTNNMTTFKFNDETVEQEAWGWIAIYKDGTHLAQFDKNTGLFHQFREIDVENLNVFALQKLDDTEGHTERLELHMNEDMKPIHYYERVILNAGTPLEKRVTLYCFGYEKQVDGKTFKSIMTIYPNGAISLKDK